jgi:hypothetical protein
MLCENCQKSFATVHLSGWQRTPGAPGEEEPEQSFEHHYCAACEEELSKTNPLLNPLLKAGPGARMVELRVISASLDWIVVRQIGPDSDSSQPEWSFLTSRLPAQYAVPGMEFGMAVTDAQLKWLRGEV